MCRAPIDATSPNRNLLCEKVIRLMPLECSFLEQGCKAVEIEDSAELLAHEKKCRFRLVRCIHPPCQFLVPVNKLVDHITNASHNFNLVTPHNAIHALEVKSTITRTGNIGKVDSPRVYWNVTHIVIDGNFSLGRKHFFAELIQTVAGERDWAFWVYMLGSEEEASAYDYTLTLNSEAHSKLQFHGLCVSVDTDIESLLKDSSDLSSSCLILANNMLVKFIVNRTLSFGVEIRKKSHKLPMAVSCADVIDGDHTVSKPHLHHFQTEYCTRMLRNVSQSYKQTKKITSISGTATAFEKGPYSRSKENQSYGKDKIQVITLS